MLNSIIKDLKQEKNLQKYSIFYIDLYNYLFFQKKELNINLSKSFKSGINLNKLLIDDYFKEPRVVNIKENTNKTGIPKEIFCQVGNYLYEKSIKK
tara:strand:+ start:203 stop:490 length:288 start_codon:yes stop_codon:yes gene_type:complete